MYQKDYLEVFLVLFRRYEWTYFLEGNSGEKTVSKRIAGGIERDTSLKCPRRGIPVSLRACRSGK